MMRFLTNVGRLLRHSLTFALTTLTVMIVLFRKEYAGAQTPAVLALLASVLAFEIGLLFPQAAEPRLGVVARDDRRRQTRLAPLALSAASLLLVLTGHTGYDDPSARGFFAFLLNYAAVLTAGFVLGARAERERFTWRDYRGSLLFGPLRWLFVATVCAFAASINGTGAPKLLAIGVFASCAMISLAREPWFLTRRATELYRVRQRALWQSERQASPDLEAHVIHSMGEVQ